MNRIAWIDNLRGLSILAVIFLQCTIAVNGNAGHFSALSERVNTLLQPLRLGLIFFVSVLVSHLSGGGDIIWFCTPCFCFLW
ncbi:hypothetical protein ACQPT2_20475 [Erwinia amylovora]